MPECMTKYHGPMRYADEMVWNFPEGLFGFEERKRFLPVELAGTRPVVFLQSLDDPQLCFVTLPVRVVDPEYLLALRPEDLRALGISQDRQPEIGSDVLCLAILTIRPRETTTANLLAPIVVHLRTRVAVQGLSAEETYSHRHPFLAPREEPVCS